MTIFEIECAYLDALALIRARKTDEDRHPHRAANAWGKRFRKRVKQQIKQRYLAELSAYFADPQPKTSGFVLNPFYPFSNPKIEETQALIAKVQAQVDALDAKLSPKTDHEEQE